MSKSVPYLLKHISWLTTNSNKIDDWVNRARSVRQSVNKWNVALAKEPQNVCIQLLLQLWLLQSGLAGVAKVHIKKLQSVQNMAARMVFGVCRSEHISPSSGISTLATCESASSLQDGLDGLEMCSWCRSSLSQWPLCTCYCHLRSSASAATGILLVPCTWTTATEQRSFTVNGPATWNCPPPALRSSDLSEGAFKRALKSHLFLTARRHRDVFMTGTARLTYLLTSQQYAFLITNDVESVTDGVCQSS